MVISIAICDDEKQVSAELERLLLNIFKKLNIYVDVDIYSCGTDLCATIKQGTRYNLIFQDIEFMEDNMSGIDVGRMIRETYNDNEVSIVYISWEKSHAMQLFGIRPLDFLIKPLTQEKVSAVIHTYLHLSAFWLKDFVYKVKHDLYKVKAKDIIYLQNDKRKVLLHLADGRVEGFYGTLKEAYQEQLHKFDFLFIHASYIVNYDYIKIIRYDKLTLHNKGVDILFPISQHNRKKVRELYYNITERRKV
ncbi:MAG: LytTR family DNA-binding domain-containing protein [Lachnospiraceae bacterium]|nr:LytTR family DNA-binding domain-containing protein [Lachnospiraceae bacterium]